MSLFSLGQSRHLNWGSRGKQDHPAARLVSGWGTIQRTVLGKPLGHLGKFPVYTNKFLICLKAAVWQFKIIRKDELTGISAVYVADIQTDW